MAYADEFMYPAVHMHSSTPVVAVEVVVEFAGQSLHV
jgi:hypothetical protein